MHGLSFYINNVSYDSIKEAMSVLNMSYTNVRRYLEPTYLKSGKKRTNNWSKKPVIVEGQHFESITEAAKYYSCSPRWLKQKYNVIQC